MSFMESNPFIDLLIILSIKHKSSHLLRNFGRTKRLPGMHIIVMKGKTMAIDLVFWTKKTPMKKIVWRTVNLWMPPVSTYFVYGVLGYKLGCLKKRWNLFQNWILGIEERPINK